MNSFVKNSQENSSDGEIISDSELFKEFKDIRNDIRNFNTPYIHRGGDFDQTSVLDGAIKGGNGEEHANNNMPLVSIDDGFGRPYSLASRTGLDSLPQGLMLYHGTKTKGTFDVTKLNLGNDKEIPMCFFSSHINLALSSIGACAPLGGDGYVHEFRIKKEIPGLYIMSIHEMQDKNLEDLHKGYCGSVDGQTYNGIMLYVDDINLRKLTGENPDMGSNIERVEVGLCRPHDWLEYVGTIRCMGPRNLSEKYNFNGTRPTASSMVSQEDVVPSTFNLREPTADDTNIVVTSNDNYGTDIVNEVRDGYDMV